MPDSGVELPSGFLTTFGRPARESACECERSSGLQLGPIMALVSGPTLGDAIADPGNELTRLVNTQGDDPKLIDELFMRILNRPATAAEIETCRKDMQAVDDDHRRMAEELGKRELRVCPEPARSSSATARRPSPLLRPHLPLTRKNWRPGSPKEKRKKAEATAKLEADLKTYETHGSRQENRRLGEGEGLVDRQPLAGPRTQGDRVPPTRRRLDQGAGRLDRRLRAQPERRL